MKISTKLAIATLAIISPIAVQAADLSAKITDAAWDGITVPKGQQCHRFGGNAMSPQLNVKNIPAAANALVLSFDDRTYQPMSNGGHGQVIYKIAEGVGSVNVPSVPAHTFDLPKGFNTLSAHRAPTWDTAGAYMPPCSGGNGNQYVVVVKAVIIDGKKVVKNLGKVDVAMGKY